MAEAPPMQRRLVALIPAAGKSLRMGRPKLLLTIDGESLIRRLVRQLSRPEVASLHVLVRADDQPLQEELQGSDADVLLSGETADMKESVARLLEGVRAVHRPGPEDAWLLIPADHPLVEQSVLNRLLDAWHARTGSIIVPAHEGRRGHPAIFPWPVAEKIPSIPPDQGLNWLVRRGGFPVREVDCTEPSILWDVDTPEDFARLRAMLSGH